MRRFASVRVQRVTQFWATACAAAAACAALAAGCGGATRDARPSASAAPTADAGAPKPTGGDGAHAAALDAIASGPVELRGDRQHTLLVALPDAKHWTRVRFMGVPSVVGFRYGKDHHAVVGVFVIERVGGDAVGACSRSFERYAEPLVEAFDVEVRHEAPRAFVWKPEALAGTGAPALGPSIVEVDALSARTATMLSREDYVGAWAAYPAWDGTCVVVGAAVPPRGEAARARAVRDRFVAEAFPRLALAAAAPPKERY